MACIVRVELHGVANYAALHEQMEGWGFSRSALNSQNAAYRLPTGTYVYYGAGTPQEIYGYADAARAAIGATATIFVGDWTRMWWGNLPPG